MHFHGVSFRASMYLHSSTSSSSSLPLISKFNLNVTITQLLDALIDRWLQIYVYMYVCVCSVSVQANYQISR